MKIRNGFVSNSSSSSFVIIGWSMEEIDSDKKDLIIEEKIDLGEGNQYLSDDGPGYVGIVLADISSEDGEHTNSRTFSLEDLTSKISLLKNKLDIKTDPKIITGARSC